MIICQGKIDNFFKESFDQKIFSMYSRKMKEIEITVFAKINIGLEVFWRRPTGYHDIESIFQNVNLADILCISIDGRSSIAVEGEVGCPPDKSSIYHAAKVFDQACGGIVEKKGVSIHVKKGIPSGAGLGGAGATQRRHCWASMSSMERGFPYRSSHGSENRLQAMCPFSCSEAQRL